MEPSSPTTGASQPLSPRRQPVAAAICAICIAVFLLEQSSLADQLNPWLAPDAFEIWRGHRLWALVTSAFVHRALWHVAVNVYWTWQLGSRLERAIGHGRFTLFVAAAAFASSGIELATAGSTGIGISGAGYAIFAFLWIAAPRDPSRFGEPLPTNTVVGFIVWLFVCLALTHTGTAPIANAAHFSGAAFGALAGAFATGRAGRLPLWGLGTLGAAALLPGLWAPWLWAWHFEKGAEAYDAGRYPDALAEYERAVELGGDVRIVLPDVAMTRLHQDDLASFDATIEALRRVDFIAAEHTRSQLAEAEIYVVTNRAAEAFRGHDWKTARDLYDRLLKRGADERKFLPWLARASYAMGDRERFKEALSELDGKWPEDAAQLRAEYQVQAEDSPK